MNNTNKLYNKKSTKKIPNIFQRAVTATMMGRTYKNSKMKCKMFVTVDILNTKL